MNRDLVAGTADSSFLQGEVNEGTRQITGESLQHFAGTAAQTKNWLGDFEPPGLRFRLPLSAWARAHRAVNRRLAPGGCVQKPALALTPSEAGGSLANDRVRSKAERPLPGPDTRQARGCRKVSSDAHRCWDRPASLENGPKHPGRARVMRMAKRG